MAAVEYFSIKNTKSKISRTKRTGGPVVLLNKGNERPGIDYHLEQRGAGNDPSSRGLFARTRRKKENDGKPFKK